MYIIMYLCLYMLLGADKVLHLRQDSQDNMHPLFVEMFDRQENVCIL